MLDSGLLKMEFSWMVVAQDRHTEAVFHAIRTPLMQETYCPES